jgi:hypothetical protein
VVSNSVRGERATRTPSLRAQPLSGGACDPGSPRAGPSAAAGWVCPARSSASHVPHAPFPSPAAPPARPRPPAPARKRHRWNIAVAPATSMEHRCRWPGRRGSQERGAGPQAARMVPQRAGQRLHLRRGRPGQAPRIRPPWPSGDGSVTGHIFAMKAFRGAVAAARPVGSAIIVRSVRAAWARVSRRNGSGQLFRC